MVSPFQDRSLHSQDYKASKRLVNRQFLQQYTASTLSVHSRLYQKSSKDLADNLERIQRARKYCNSTSNTTCDAWQQQTTDDFYQSEFPSHYRCFKGIRPIDKSPQAQAIATPWKADSVLIRPAKAARRVRVNRALTRRLVPALSAPSDEVPRYFTIIS